MTKNELTEMLKELDIPVYEGYITNGTGVYPRINYFDYVWEDMMASSEMYEEIETYQISFFSKTPRHMKLIELRQKLRENDIHPAIYHEYVLDENNHRCVHSYFKVEVAV